MEEGRETTEKEKSFEGDLPTALQPRAETLPTTDFVKVEKNLASLGFFTPSSKRTRDEKSKTVSVTVVIDGKRFDAKATIAPTALFGLPITADQDKWLALHKILSDIQTRDGEVRNPISFTSAELLALLRIYKDSGKNYRDVSDWLDVMVGTTIISEGAVYVSGKRAFGKDTFHVFDRAVSFGKELPDGSIADKNYVWLSSWQLQNINNHHQLPIDLDTYRQLKNYIAKALVPLLQVWLYATRDDGVFEKRYDELCQILNVRQWNFLSKIREKLGPSLDELREFGYLADWQIGKMSDNRSYKIIFYHGEKFHRDRRARLGRKKSSVDGSTGREPATRASISGEKPNAESWQDRSNFPAAAARPTFDPQLVAEFTRRGIREEKAIALLANLKPGQDVIAQLEYTDHTIKKLEETPHRLTNPAGFYVRMVEWNTPVPDGFETSARRNAREAQERKDRERRAADEAHQELEDAYENYCYDAVDRYIEDNPAAYEAVREAKAKQERSQYPSAWPEMITRAAQWAAKYEIRKKLNLPTFEEFIALKKQGTDFSLKPAAPSPAEAPSLASAPREIIRNDGADSGVVGSMDASDNMETNHATPQPAPPPAIPETTTSEPPAMPATDTPEAAPDTEKIENSAIRQEPEILPETLEPVTDLISEPTHDEQGSDPIGPALV